MAALPDSPPSRDDIGALWFTELNPGPQRSRELRAVMAAGATASVHVTMEVLELDDRSGRALLWITDQAHKLPPRLASAKLSASRRAEIIAAQSAGYRVWLTVSYQVLAERDGAFAAVTDDLQGALRTGHADVPAELADLLG